MRRKIVQGAVALAAALLVFAIWRGAPDSPDSVTAAVQLADVASEPLTTPGSVVGYAGPGDSHAWLGIPFAAPPTDELRWRPPQRPEPWTDTLDALAYGARASSSPVLLAAFRTGTRALSQATRTVSF